MTDYNRPNTLPAWAESGDTIQPSNAEIQEGWPLSNTPPSRQRFNWILNWISNGVRYLMQLGVPEWDTDEPYRIGSRVQYSGKTYKAIAVNSGDQPDISPASWVRWGFDDDEIQPRVDRVLSKNVGGSANVTLTAAEAEAGIIILTGTLTGSINVIVPNAGRRWAIHNGTSGDYTVGLKTASGASIEAPQGRSVTVYCDGANTLRLAGSANEISINKVSATATAGQTSFPATYSAGAVFLVTRNGVGVSYTASSGTDVVLSAAASLGDVIEIFIAEGFNLVNAVMKSGDTMIGPLVLSGNATLPLHPVTLQQYQTAASTTASGIVELATNAETQTGTDTARAVTPAGLASVTATETRAGLVELATTAEVQTGTDTARAVTPAGLAARTATETRAGVVELATTAEVQTGTDTDRAVTPAGLAASVIGMGQTWQDVTASRAVSTTYTNSTGRPIMVSVMSIQSGTTGSDVNRVRLNVSGVGVFDEYKAPGSQESRANAIAIVPNGATYSVSVATNLSRWMELR